MKSGWPAYFPNFVLKSLIFTSCTRNTTQKILNVKFRFIKIINYNLAKASGSLAGLSNLGNLSNLAKLGR